MRKIKITLFLLAFIVGGLNAQTTTIENVMGIRSAQSSGEIKTNEKIVGYYVFYFKEKVDNKTSAYEVKTFDDNYNEVKSFEITRPKNTMFVEMAYNGSVFMFHFYDRKTGYEYVTYDIEGNKKGTHTVPKKEINMYDLARVGAAANAEGGVNYIYAIGTEGFMRSTFSKNKKMGYELVHFNNECEQVWAVGSPEDSKLLETLEISDVNEEITIGMITRKKSIMTKSFDVFGVLIDSKTGEVLKEIEMGNDTEGRRSMLKSFISLQNSSVSIVGEYYKPKDDIIKDRSAGLYIQDFSLSGKELSLKKYAWKGDFDKFKQNNLSADEKKNDKGTNFIFFHNVIQSKNGKITLVGEQFAKQLSAGGLASKALGGSEVSAFEIRVKNMVVIEFDNEKDLVGYNIIAKKSRPVYLQAGSAYISSMVLGYMVKSYGGFDYSFTSSDYDTDKHDIIYTDANRKEEKGSKKSDLMIGVISVHNGELATARTPINTESNYFWFQPGKPGYISIGEYDRKEKSIELRLEPISF